VQCTKISGAGLRIEYKFINQSKQRIEKSLTNQKISARKPKSIINKI
jgi:hypothetical protein